MKMIINGRLYDTDTARKIGSYDNGYGGGDFRRYYEILYRKRTGEYFLYGSGGPMSKYSESFGSTTSGTSEIIPYTEGEAKEWAVRHLDADDYMEIFGTVEE